MFCPPRAFVCGQDAIRINLSLKSIKKRAPSWSSVRPRIRCSGVQGMRRNSRTKDSLVRRHSPGFIGFSISRHEPNIEMWLARRLARRRGKHLFTGAARRYAGAKIEKGDVAQNLAQAPESTNRLNRPGFDGVSGLSRGRFSAPAAGCTQGKIAGNLPQPTPTSARQRHPAVHVPGPLGLATSPHATPPSSRDHSPRWTGQTPGPHPTTSQRHASPKTRIQPQPRRRSGATRSADDVNSQTRSLSRGLQRANPLRRRRC